LLFIRFFYLTLLVNNNCSQQHCLPNKPRLYLAPVQQTINILVFS
jgi:hypothetical protein